MTPITNDQIAELLAGAAGDVSYVSNYSKTTAIVKDGRWISKRFAGDVMRDIREAERKAAYVAPVRPVVGGARSLPYAGPFPRGRHSHRCVGCEHTGQHHAVACYRSKCTRPQLTATCSYCARIYSGQ